MKNIYSEIILLTLHRIIKFCIQNKTCMKTKILNHFFCSLKNSKKIICDNKLRHFNPDVIFASVLHLRTTFVFVFCLCLLSFDMINDLSQNKYFNQKFQYNINIF